MIVVVEGASAAGKTTWCRMHHPDVTVSERADDPGVASLDPSGRHEVWVERNSERWARALEVEEMGGLAVCDGDPFKLHYTWALWRIGEIPRSEWRLAAKVSRLAFETDRLGLADLVLVSAIDFAELRRRRLEDRERSGRARRRFELHARLAEPLREWYEAVGRLEAGRVRWSLPEGGVLPPVAPRRSRSGADLFDALQGELPQ